MSETGREPASIGSTDHARLAVVDPTSAQIEHARRLSLHTSHPPVSVGVDHRAIACDHQGTGAQDRRPRDIPRHQRLHCLLFLVIRPGTDCFGRPPDALPIDRSARISSTTSRTRSKGISIANRLSRRRKNVEG